MINIGIIGMSEGNAHPYSWSSIINGQYDGDVISNMGFPAVADYLMANEDTLGVPRARVQCVWTQDVALSESIARSAGIRHIADRLEDMVGLVDAVMLSRDDPENHRQMAAPFIEAGIPVFVDKPLAYSNEDLSWFDEQVKKGAFVMSCSSMRYAPECRSLKQSLLQLGKIPLVTAVGKKDWKKYGIHLLEAMSSVLNDPLPLAVRYIGEVGRDVVQVEFEGGTIAMLHLVQEISPTFQMTFFGVNDWWLVDVKNSYAMFKENILEFIRAVEEGKPRLNFEKTYRLIRVLIAARESAAQGGIRIQLS